MAVVGRLDPLKVFRFRVEWLGIQRAGFKAVGGLVKETAVVPYREGDEIPTPSKSAGLTEYPTATFARGLIADDGNELWDWSTLVEDHGLVASVPEPEYKKDVSVVLLDKGNDEKRRWNLDQAWVCRYEISDFDSATSEVLLTTMTLCYQGLTEVPPT